MCKLTSATSTDQTFLDSLRSIYQAFEVMRKEKSSDPSGSSSNAANSTKQKKHHKDLDPTTNERLSEDLWKKLINGIDSKTEL